MKTEDFSEFDARRKFEEEQKERKRLKRQRILQQRSERADEDEY